MGKPYERQREIAAIIGEAVTETGDTKTLAGSAAGEHLNRTKIGSPDTREVAEVRHIGKAIFQHRARKRLDFGKRRRLPIERCSGNAERFDTAANRYITHGA